MTEEQRVEVKTRIICTLFDNWDRFGPTLTEEQMALYLDIDKEKKMSISDLLDVPGEFYSKFCNNVADKIIERF